MEWAARQASSPCGCSLRGGPVAVAVAAEMNQKMNQEMPEQTRNQTVPKVGTDRPLYPPLLATMAKDKTTKQSRTPAIKLKASQKSQAQKAAKIKGPAKKGTQQPKTSSF